VAIRLPFSSLCDPFGKYSLGFPNAGGSRFYSRRAFASRAAEGEAQSSVRLRRHHLPPLS
jgi:hypothetical protein